jgi:GAF domain-containing protein
MGGCFTDRRGRGDEQARLGEEKGGAAARPPGLWERALEQERRFRSEALALLRAVEGLNGAGRLAQVLEAIRGGARELLQAQRAVARPLGEDGIAAEAGAVSLEAWSLQSRKMIWLENAWIVQNVALPSLEDGSAPGAAVAAPLFLGGCPCGVVAAYFDAPRLFTRADRQLLLSFIRQASIAIQRSVSLSPGAA